MVQNDVAATIEKGDGIIRLPTLVSQPAADEPHDHIVRRDLKRVVPQADPVARRCLPGDGYEGLDYAERAFQIDRAGNAEDHGAMAPAYGIAEGARSGIFQVGDIIDQPGTAAGREGTPAFGAGKGRQGGWCRDLGWSRIGEGCRRN
ncbi:MAG: hypothetical protein P8Y80_01345 [Acidobacteriota bacterium]